MLLSKKNDFSQGKVWKTIVNMAVPMMLAELVNVLYSVVDRMYIGHIPGVGYIALTGLGITTPIVSITAAFSSLCGTGGGPLFSIARGSEKQEEAEVIMGNTFTMIILLGLTLTFVFILFMKPLLFLFGASEATYKYAADYGYIYVCGTLFSMLSLGMNYFINAQGFARKGMMTIILGAVVNIVLDPIFIFALNLGIKGAAIATLIAQIASAAWVTVFLTGPHTLLKIKFQNMKLRIDILKRILALGFSSFFMKITTGLVQILYNRQLNTYGGDAFIGSMTVVNSVRDVFFMTFHGLTNACQPVIGFNYGAKKYDRVVSGIRFTTLACGLYSVICWFLAMLFPGTIALIFTNSDVLLQTCVPAMRIFFCGFMFKSLQMVGQCVFVALGKSKSAIFFSILRKIIIVIPLIYLLPNLWNLGGYGIFLSEPIADIVCSTVCYTTMFFTVYKKMDTTAYQ